MEEATMSRPELTPASSEAALLVALTRMEAKVDVALAQHGADIQSHAKDIGDHEDRIRRLESKPTVSPKALWTAIGSGAGLILAGLQILERLTQ